MYKKSECEAYKAGKKCREDILKKCPPETDRTALEDGIERDKDRIDKYCQ